MQLRSGRQQTKAASPVPPISPVVSPFQILAWLKLPLLCTSWTLPRALFSVNMVEQEPKSPSRNQQQQNFGAQPIPDAAASEPGPLGTRICYVSTSKGSQMVLFFSPGSDAKHILTEIVRRHNLQFKELGRVKSKHLAVCMHAEDRKGYKLTNDMILRDFAPNQDKVYLYAYTEDSTLAAKRAAPTVGEGEAQAPKKAKAATPANGAASGSGATPAEGGKKRGRPTNKEKAEKEAAAAAKAAEEGKPSGDEQAKAPATAQVANEAKPAAAKPAAAAAAAKPTAGAAKPPSAKKGTKSKQAAQATPTEQTQPTKAPAKTPASTSAAKEEESSSEESGSGSEEGSEEESSSGDESSEEEEDKSPEAAPAVQAAQKKESSEEDSSSEEE